MSGFSSADPINLVSDEEDLDVQELYVVERIIGHRFRRGQLQFLVHWEGLPVSDASWEDCYHVQDAPDAKASNWASLEKGCLQH